MRGINNGIWIVALIISFSGHSWASFDSMGPNGINSLGLGLNGSGIGIGQVETGRPGNPTFGLPVVDMPANTNPDVRPSGVFLRNANATPDMNITSHAQQVAGVMISRDMTDSELPPDGDYPVGVAPNALLFSSATNVPTLPGQPEAALSAQHVATRNGGDVRAINFSFGEQLVGSDVLDGKSLLTEFVDWSASAHDVLYVIAGNEDAGGIPVPTDNFNGITVGFTQKVGSTYRRVDGSNNYGEDAVGGRTSVGILAPGRNIEVTGFGSAENTDSGTSFSTPRYNRKLWTG